MTYQRIDIMGLCEIDLRLAPKIRVAVEIVVNVVILIS